MVTAFVYEWAFFFVFSINVVDVFTLNDLIRSSLLFVGPSVAFLLVIFLATVRLENEPGPLKTPTSGRFTLFREYAHAFVMFFSALAFLLMYFWHGHRVLLALCIISGVTVIYDSAMRRFEKRAGSLVPKTVIQSTNILIYTLVITAMLAAINGARKDAALLFVPTLVIINPSQDVNVLAASENETVGYLVRSLERGPIVKFGKGRAVLILWDHEPAFTFAFKTDSDTLP